jgi:hypothetical protein
VGTYCTRSSTEEFVYVYPLKLYPDPELLSSSSLLDEMFPEVGTAHVLSDVGDLAIG